MTYEAQKSTPTDLGSCRKVRECKSVAKTVCLKQQTKVRKSDMIGKRIIIYIYDRPKRSNATNKSVRKYISLIVKADLQ